MDEPKFIDAKFKVIRGRSGRRPWFDWRNFLIVGGLSLAATAGQVVRDLLQ